MTRLIVEIEEIEGNCVVFKGNERIVIEGAEIKLEETDKICIHALQSILHYAVALREGVDPKEVRIGKGRRSCLCPMSGSGRTLYGWWNSCI